MSPDPFAAAPFPPGRQRRAVILVAPAVALGAIAAALLGLWAYGQMAVRHGEAALSAQAADLATRAAAAWPGAGEDQAAPPPQGAGLESDRILPARPAPGASLYPPDIDAIVAASRLTEQIGKSPKSYPASVVMLDQRGLVVMGPGPGGDLSSLAEVRSALEGRPMSVLRRNRSGRVPLLGALNRASGVTLDYAQPILVRGRVAGALLLSRAPTGSVLGGMALIVGGLLITLIAVAGLAWGRRVRSLVPAETGPAETDLVQGADPRLPLRHIAQALTRPGFVVSPYITGELPDVTMPAAALETVLAALIETSRQAGASRVDILADAKGDAVRLTLADNGADVHVDDHHRVFEPLYASRRVEGARGGLPIARSLVEAHGGELFVLDPESGAAFQLHLRAVRAA